MAASVEVRVPFVDPVVARGRSGFRQRAGNFISKKMRRSADRRYDCSSIRFRRESFTGIAADFSAANELYAKGKFSDAAGLYETILKTGAQSPALLFNYANAEFKAGHPGEVGAWRSVIL